MAERLGVAKSFVSHLVVGRKLPSLRTAARIERLTRNAPGGAILAVEWVQDAAA